MAAVVVVVIPDEVVINVVAVVLGLSLAITIISVDRKNWKV